MAALAANSAEEVVRTLARRLHQAGHVTASFEAAAIARERRSPTGLPFTDVAVAIPHAEPEHVISPAIAIASLAHPVRFRQMGSPAIQLDVLLVVMPAFTEKQQAAAGLSELIERLQNDALRLVLSRATTAEALCEALEGAR